MRAPPTAVLRWSCLAALVTGICAAFGGVGANGFLWWDDASYVTENAHVKAGVGAETIRWALTSSEAANWHPLTWMSHALDASLFGLDARAHHFVSLALHALTSVLLVLLVARWTGRFGRAWFAGALFALHPLRVESVAWIAERKDVLSGLFFVLTLSCWTRWVERPSVARYVLALAVFALGLMSKPMLVTLPFVLLACDAWPFHRLRWPHLDSPARGAAVPFGAPEAAAALVREKLPFFALAACACVATVLAQRAGGALKPELAPGLVERVANAFAACATYLGKSFAPFALSPYYAWRSPWSNPAFYAGLLSVPFVVWLAWRTRARAPWFAFGSALFLGMLVPVIGLVPVGDQALADRYTYLPSIGLWIAVVWGLARRAERLRALRALAGVGVLALAGCCLLTARQVRYWRDDVTLFSRALELDPRNAVAHKNLGKALLAKRDVAAAIEHLRAAAGLEPRYAEAWWNLGIALGMSGDFAASIDALTRARELAPWVAEIHYNLGVAQLASKRGDEAFESFERTLALAPAHVGAHGNLGRLLRQRGRIEEAAEHFSAAWRAEPSNDAARRALAACELELGRVESALRDHADVLRADPETRARTLAALRAAIDAARARGDVEAQRRLEELGAAFELRAK